ncbi:AAA family ATPase [Desulfovibrio porci]|uniref:AAA family ATPase n=1 Tax=Desulfovibrio porci TaxID=2605782 RepID=UPI002A830579|nr:AAA family ATPase [Desulfovibrio porci]MDY3810183.1 AAA family ATPase [Desulfovibrio porci]
MTDLLHTFRDVLGQHGLVPEEILTDGNLHRCPTEGKPHKLNGAYIAHLDKPATLWWCNWETDDQGTFCAEEQQTVSVSELSTWRERQQSIQQQREAECTRRHTEAAKQAGEEWSSARVCDANHPYLRRKNIPALEGIRQARDGALLIPVLDAADNLQSLQRIYSDGTKHFHVGGKVSDGRFIMQGQPEKPIAICEGFATGASIHLATGWTVYVAFSANNMPVVAKSARDRFPDKAIIICGDNDEAGRKKGEEAAGLANAQFVLPHFTSGNGTDFNDLHQIEGLEAVRSQLESALVKQHGLVALDMSEFLSMQIPDRGYLLSPILPVQGIAILYAPRGVGKTFAALSVAVAVASGGAVFNWRAPMPKKTLYVDGEMPATSMQSRLSSLVGGMAIPPQALKNLSLITPDLQPCAMPDLSTPNGQAMIEPLLKGVDMLVLDNIATLCRTGKENESQSWQAMQTWLLDLRRRGITVLLIHHAGKSGDQRGTSAKEDIMDTVISLRRPKEYAMAEGARFEVHLTKARGILGDDAKPFEANLITEGNALHWQVREIEDVELEELKRLLDEGYSIRDCAEEMGKSKGAIQRLKKKLEACSR